MRWYMYRMIGLGATAAVLFGMTSGCAGPVDPVANEIFLASLGNTSVTVFPAFVREGETAYDAAAAVALAECFAENGLAESTVSQEHVLITGLWGMNQAKMFQESFTEFAEYVKANPIESEYGLLAEYLMGGRGTFLGVHCYIVDKEGRMAWGRLWNSHDEAFAEATLQTPEDCTAMLTQELARLLVPADTQP